MAGDPPPRADLLGFGHSHVGAYLKAWRQRGREGREAGLAMHFARLGHENFQPNFEEADGRRRVAASLERRIAHLFRRHRPRAVLCVLMGNEYNSLAMIRHPRPFDVAWPGEDPREDRDAGEAVEILSRALMTAQLTELAEQNALLLWRAIAAEAGRHGAPVLLVPPPPPIPDAAHIRAHPGRFGALVAEHGLNPAPMRRRMWRCYCAALEAAVAGGADDGAGGAAARTTFVDLPASVAEDGYLPARFRQGDPTHGNRDYGEIMLDHVLALAARARPAGQG